MLSHFSCVRLCDPMECSPPSSFVLGILQTRIVEWVAMPSYMGSYQPRDGTCVSYVSCIGRQVFYHWYHLGSPGILSLVPFLKRWKLGTESFSNLPRAAEQPMAWEGLLPVDLLDLIHWGPCQQVSQNPPPLFLRAE